TGTPLPSITVKWTSLSTGNWVKLTTTNPSNVVLVNVSTVSALVPGTISNPSQNKNYNSIPGDFTCSVATNGYCSPTFVYQWQSSSDNINFLDMSGATLQNLHFTTGLTQTTYYR